MQDISKFKMYSMQDVAEILGVTYRTVLRYKNAGKLKTVTIGRRILVNEEELKKFLAGENE